MMSIRLRDLVTVEISVRPTVDLGGGRWYVAFDGGTFAGRDGVSGEVVEGGVDWQVVRAEGVIEIDAHYALRTEAGEAIEVVSTGLRKATDAVAARIARGETVTAEESSFRTPVRFSTSATQLAWLNDLIAISTGERQRDIVRIHVHEVL